MTFQQSNGESPPQGCCANRPSSLADHEDGDRLAGTEGVVAVEIRGRVVGLVNEDGDVEVVIYAPTSAQREVVTIALVRSSAG